MEKIFWLIVEDMAWKNDPYLISSKADMEALASAVNAGNNLFLAGV